jgi:hypothetical protein
MAIYSEHQRRQHLRVERTRAAASGDVRGTSKQNTIENSLLVFACRFDLGLVLDGLVVRLWQKFVEDTLGTTVSK